MSHEHHDHEHEHEKDYITLVDEEGNESLFEILLTIDGEEEFSGKQYVLLFPAGMEEDDDEDDDHQSQQTQTTHRSTPSGAPCAMA